MLARLVLAAALAVPALATGASAHPVAAATGMGGAECSVAGSIAPSPGVTYAPGSVTYTMSGTLDCLSSDAGISHGTLTGTATGTRSCLLGLSDARMAIAWTNGMTSDLRLTFGDLAYGRGGIGAVETGVFKGDTVSMGVEQRTGGGEVRCATDKVGSYEFGGELDIMG